MTREDTATLRGIPLMLIAGILLGLTYNAIGLRSRHPWGLSWIAEDKLAELAEMEQVGAGGNGAPAGSSLYTGSDDPLAIAASPALPEIPAIGRPVRIELDALVQYHQAQAALFIDARDRYEYEEAHIPGAVNMPYDEVVTDPAALESLDTGGRPIVTYCGGGTCEVSLKLAEELLYAGHPRVAIYVGGFPEWVEAGQPIAGGSDAAGGGD